MLTEILLLIAGLVLVLAGADALVEGASGIARKAGIGEFVIGMTVVAFGTSAPEMVVSFISSAQGRADMAVGNIVGSNIFNTAFVLGITALICPVTVTRTNMRRDMPMNVVSTLLLILASVGGVMDRADGGLLLVVFAVYMWTAFRSGDREDEQQDVHGDDVTWVAVARTLAGLAALVVGGHMFVGGAEDLAARLGMSDKLIGVTVLAFGTSLPELATSIVAAVKGKSQMALGNVLGSNVFNILLILGGAALIRPLAISGIGWVDFTAVLLCSLAVPACAAAGSKGSIHVWSGIALLLIGTAYMAYLCMTA